MSDKILDFWNSRSSLGTRSGTEDFMLTELEQIFIKGMVPENSRVLDIGCGTSQTLIELSKNKNCSGVGIDFSPGMVDKSIENIESNALSSKIKIYRSSVPPIPEEFGLFDVVLTNRSLINLPNVKLQEEAVKGIEKIVKPGGMYLMIECSINGLESTNNLRKMLDIEPLTVPWHNVFFKEEDVKSWQTKDFRIKDFLHITSTYYFLSRVINAKQSKILNRQPNYDDDLNKISLLLPQQIGTVGSVKAWVWEKSV